MLTAVSANPDYSFSDGRAVEAAAAFVNRLKADCHVLVAVSGGSDSLGLLVLLSEARHRAHRSDIRLSAATVDHSLRAQSAGEAAFVARFCADRGICHETLVWRGAKPSTGIMAAARDARYDLLSRHAVAVGADVIAVGHTLDDQAETFEMRKARSSHPGISGMAAQTLLFGRVWLARPLLGVSRQAIRGALSARGIGWIDDPSNDNARYERVRVRRALDGAVSGPGSAAHAAGSERARRAAAAAALFQAFGRIHGQTVAELDLDALDAQGGEGARALLNALVAIIGGETHGPGQAALDDMLRLRSAAHGERMTAGRCLFEVSRNRLFILRERRGVSALDIPPGASDVFDGRFEVENRSDRTVTIEAGNACGCDHAEFQALPRRLAQVAVATAPSIEREAGRIVTGRVLSPYRRYLPGFDLVLANRLALAFGAKCYPEPSYFLTEY